MAWVRKSLLGLGALVLVATAGMVYLVATFDPNAYKGMLVDWVQENKQRTLSINGPVSLAVWPRLHVQLSDVAMSEHRQNAEFARLQSVDLAVQLMPLLKGQLRVGQVKAQGVNLRYVRDAQGRSNIDDLLGPAQEPVADQASQELSFDVEGISLKDVSADVADAMSGVQAKIQLAAFESGRLADGVSTPLSVQASVDIAKPRAASVQLDGTLNLTPALAAKRFSVSDLAMQVQLKDRDAKGQVQTDVKADLKSAQAVWDGLKRAASADDVQIKLSGNVGQGQSALVVDQLVLTASHVEADPQAQAFKLDKLDALFKGQQGGQARELAAQWPQLSILGSQVKGSALQGRFDVAGPVAVSGTFKSEVPQGSFETMVLPGLSVDFKASMAGKEGQREVIGQLKSRVSVNAQTLSGQLDQLALQARITEPSLQPLAVRVQGRVAGSMPLSAEWALRGDINANEFSSDGRVRLAQGVPDVQAKARFASLDLNRLLPAPTAAAGATNSSPASAQALDNTPIDLSALGSVNGRFELAAGQLAWRHFRVADAVILAGLQGGRLTLDQLSGAAWGGRFKAQGTAQGVVKGAQGSGQQQVALQAQADGVNVLALIKDVAGKEMLEGTGQLTLQVQSAGATVGALTSALAGTGKLVLRDGAVRGINLAKSLREAKAKLKLSSQSDAVQKASQTEKTDFTEMTASFVIQHGVARNQDLSAKSPFLRITGAGDIDLVRKRIDYTVNSTITGTVKGQDGADLDALKGLTVPVKLAGPFDALDWRVAWSGVALGAVQNTLKGQLDGKLDNVGGKLEDQLKAKLLGKPAAVSGASSGASAASAPAPSVQDAAKDKLKDKLKGLFK